MVVTVTPSGKAPPEPGAEAEGGRGVGGHLGTPGDDEEAN